MCVVSVGRCVCIGCNYVCATVLYYGLGGWVVLYVGGGCVCVRRYGLVVWCPCGFIGRWAGCVWCGWLFYCVVCVG